jgi:hypothetical protein
VLAPHAGESHVILMDDGSTADDGNADDAIGPADPPSTGGSPAPALRDAIVARLTVEFGSPIVFRGHHRWVVRRPPREGESEPRAVNVAIDFDRRPAEARVWSAARPGQSEHAPAVIVPIRDLSQVAALVTLARGG